MDVGWRYVGAVEGGQSEDELLGVAAAIGVVGADVVPPLPSSLYVRVVHDRSVIHRGLS
jgi:hypothetical protein